jgi:UDP-2,3-diacylglucosamine hydrolase
MERSLALMAGAGVLPGRAAAEARRQGWRVVAFAFEDAPGLADAADVVVPSAIADIQAVIVRLYGERPKAALFVGKFWKQRAFEEAERADQAARQLAGGGLSDAALAEMVVATLEGMGIEVLDQRGFLAPSMAPSGVLTQRAPSEQEWGEVAEGAALARQLAGHGIGQTVVRCFGVTVAVEAIEGTDETIRRGTRLSGPGAVVVKGVAASHDYRFDIPAIGPATIQAMADGGATVLAVEAGRVLLVDREELIRHADRSGIAVVSIDGR